MADEVPGTIVTGLIGTVASSGEQPELAWDFLQKNYDALFAKQGAQFRDQFIANFMTNFSDESRAAELAAFAPVQATSGGRVMAGRAQEVIAISRRSQEPRAAGDRCLDQGAQMMAALVLRSVALHRHSG